MGTEKRDEQWAIKVFRPLLKDLKLQEKKKEPFTVFTSQYQIFHRYNMTNCMIEVKTKVLSSKDARGLFIWQYDEEANFYVLRIILNPVLFDTDDIELRIRRKATGIHEFTHCVASMLLFSRLQSKVLIEKMQVKMSATFHTLDESALEALFNELTMSYDKKVRDNIITFPDEHFRIGGEEFDGSYDILARNFLLSYELFCEDDFFNQTKQKEFKELLKQGKQTDALKLLISVIEPLSIKKALSQHFIIQRINEEFLQRITSGK